MKFRQKYKARDTLAILPKALESDYETTSGPTQTKSGIAVIDVTGPLEHHDGFWFDSYDAIEERCEEAFRDEAVRAVVLKIDSPGGDAAGATELHRSLRAMRAKYNKPLYAYANETACSAAYNIASAADEIWLPDTGNIGSIGVIAQVCDRTKANARAGLNVQLVTTGARKADMHDDRELTPEVLASIQKRVDKMGAIFFKSVAKARGISPQKVQALEAGVFLGADAVAAGLADGITGWHKFLALVCRVTDTDVTVSNQGLSGKMKTKLLQALAKRDKALAALCSAKTDDDRTKAAATFEAASELAAKLKYVKKTEETYDEEEEDSEKSDEKSDEDEESDEDDSDDDDKKDDDDDSDDDDDDDDKGDDSDEDEDEEDEEDEEKSKSKKMSASVLAAARRLTGKRDVSEVLGALSAMGPRIKSVAVTEARVARLEATERKGKVDAMLATARKEGRVTKDQLPSLRAQGMKDPKWLKGFLGASSKKLRTIDDGEFTPDAKTQATLGMSSLSADQAAILRSAAQSAGQSVEDFSTELARRIPSKGARI